MWQDYVITVVQVVFVFALIPTITHPTQKPPLLSCVVTASGMIALTISYYSLSLWFSATLATVVTLEWLMVGIQRYRLNKASRVHMFDMPLGKWLDIILCR